MCRCCQSCWEEIYWNCVEEKFCYDESIANYNPDDEYATKNCEYISAVPQSDNNNIPICTQPLNRNSALSSKIHEEDYRREIQTSVPILAPEILAVFANSQIFHENQPKLTRNVTRPYLAGVHGKEKESDQEKLIKQLEGCVPKENENKKTIKFTISPDSPPSSQESSVLKNNNVILEEGTTEKDETNMKDEKSEKSENDEKNEVILRPSKINQNIDIYKQRFANKQLRNVQSVPYFAFRPASENDIFAITGSMGQISMTPEIPSISFSMLPKNYEDTPTIERYKESISLYSIQTANEAKAQVQVDYSMPRYFRRSGFVQSADSFNVEKVEIPKRPEKSKRLKNLRDSLPPLRIHSIRNKTKDD